jgi:DNA-binding response OmpR family regulator
MSNLESIKNFHLLVVDDEETARTSLGEILRLEGYQVETASDGEIAIRLIDQHLQQGTAYDLILLDLKMPGVDGLEVLRFITQLTPELADLNRPTVILLTAHGSLESAIEALRYGAHDYLIKPSSPDQIIKSVSQALELRRDRKHKVNLINELEVSIKRLKAIDGPEAASSAKANSKTEKKAKKSEAAIYQLTDKVNIDLARREIHFTGYKNEKQQSKLTPTEGKLMQVFLENPKRVFTHRELVARVQGYDVKEWEAAEVLRPLVSRLRRKLCRIPGGEAWIVSIRGTGYVFDQNVK